MNHRPAAALLTASLLLASCAAPEVAPEGGPATVSGVITTRPPAQLEEGAILVLSLLDASVPPDREGRVVARSLLDAPSEFPIEFELTFDPARIDRRGRYELDASVLEDSQLRWVTRRHPLVLTRGRPSHVRIVLSPADTERP